jgi:hypothetical protein
MPGDGVEQHRKGFSQFGDVGFSPHVGLKHRSPNWVGERGHGEVEYGSIFIHPIA